MNDKQAKQVMEELGFERIVFIDDQFDFTDDEQERLVAEIVGGLGSEHKDDVNEILKHHEISYDTGDTSFDQLNWENEQEFELVRNFISHVLLDSESPRSLVCKLEEAISEDRRLSRASITPPVRDAFESAGADVQELSPAKWDDEGKKIMESETPTLYCIDYHFTNYKRPGTQLVPTVAESANSRGAIILTSSLDDESDSKNAEELRQELTDLKVDPQEIGLLGKNELNTDLTSLQFSLQFSRNRNDLLDMIGKLVKGLEVACKKAMDDVSAISPREVAQLAIAPAFSEGIEPEDFLRRVFDVHLRQRLIAQTNEEFGGVGKYNEEVDVHRRWICDLVGTPRLGSDTKTGARLDCWEYFESTDELNERHTPVVPGDIFLATKKTKRHYVYLSQVCGAQLRGDGTRSMDAWEHGFLVPLVKQKPHTFNQGESPYYAGLGSSPVPAIKLPPLEERDYENGAEGVWVDFTKAIPVPLAVLDPTMLSKQGECVIPTTPRPTDPPLYIEKWYEDVGQILIKECAAHEPECNRDPDTGDCAVGAVNDLGEATRAWAAMEPKRAPDIKDVELKLGFKRVKKLRFEHMQQLMAHFFAYRNRPGVPRPLARGYFG